MASDFDDDWHRVARQRIGYAVTQSGVDLISGLLDNELGEESYARGTNDYYDTHAVPAGFKKEDLVLAMGRCTGCFEKLPLVQDKAILDNILYSGVWMELHRQQRKDQRKEEQ